MSAAASTPPARKGKKNRVALNARIDGTTAIYLKGWSRPDPKAKRVSQGVLIDRLAAHAYRTGFNPANDCL